MTVTPLLATVVDTSSLLKTVAASFVVGVGITLVFSTAIFGATRFSELRRDDRVIAAAGSAVLALTSLAVCIGAIVLGIIVMTQK